MRFVLSTLVWIGLVSMTQLGAGDSEPFPRITAMEQIAMEQTYKIDSFITRLHKSGYFNGTLLVAKKGEILYHSSFGLADLKNKKDSLTNEDAYQMASVSKPITAAAIMLLVKEGKVNLDTSLTTYLPELKRFKRASVRHLLNHTAGVPEYIYRAASYWPKGKYMSNENLIKFFASRRYRLQFTPGSKYRYSNSNYALLASIVERVSGKPFDEFAQERIFDRLGMCNTVVFNPDKDTSMCRTIKGYHWVGYWKEYKDDYRNGIVGDKGVFSTADDMMRFAVGMQSEALFCNEEREDIFKRTKLRWGGDSEYGIGWRIREWDSMKVVLHYGFWNSFRTGVIQFPESEVTFVILNNLTGSSRGRVNNRNYIIDELMKIMFAEHKLPAYADAGDPEESESDSAEGEVMIEPIDTNLIELPVQEGGGE